MNNIQIKANKLASDIINKALKGVIVSDNESENSLLEKELMKIEENLQMISYTHYIKENLESFYNAYYE